jgi:hypothetical protein
MEPRGHHACAVAMIVRLKDELASMTAERDAWKAKHDKLAAFLEQSTMIYKKD